MTSKVFIPHVPTRYDRASDTRVPSIDVNPAAQYGEFVRMVDPNVLITANNLPDVLEQAQTSISAMTPDDYLLCVGDVVLVSAAIAYACDMFGTVKLLRWERQNKSYDIVEVSL